MNQCVDVDCPYYRIFYAVQLELYQSTPVHNNLPVEVKVLASTPFQRYELPSGVAFLGFPTLTLLLNIGLIVWILHQFCQMLGLYQNGVEIGISQPNSFIDGIGIC
jgi:hypothetical protein